MDTQTTATTFDVSGMDCAGCSRKIDKALRELDGVQDVSLHYPDTMLGVLHDGRVSEDAIRQTVEGLGFTVSPAKGL
ncbi:heavy-metal-associated domain-containing protein [Aureimonas altamirensis]|mgnify:CR=1 FL=1|uniref:heavy-metal-associated domain-containing protein n=1 Tax=Aureimonas altamirensis TaxID=370622 RepID=UPI0020371211|nr:heavy metal-associated domain-containing protein [Aureimonas altamirensis]MCM2505702.1 heavy-metal-associated domain-containing protein [Aureimonas altamirensis]